ncbi:alpha/beta hydrolase [Heyndrickxia sporothermodurans]|uniref:alpha/beta fold hydrolase n=1 Tax=Heyndrickxia sporothermodurans TaxID=46224 RepID=UPI002E2289F1|nr:alpha/beta hydrolase [Heyndrickxia sporothermodurans]MED3781018.1 alpha/beta hydrolase [Heyndrickxia sporothermodurans]
MILKRTFMRMTVALLLIIGLSLLLLHHTSSNKNSLPNENRIPTIFVHGFKGTSKSFNTMLNRFENNYFWGRKTMVCRVSHNGHVFISGGIPKNQKHPFIQIIFENNRSTIQNTTDELKDVMKVLKHRYGINDTYAVGHSMGGLVLTNYIEQTSNKKRYPIIKKLITIGSPFKGIERKSYYKNPNNTGPAVKDLKPNSGALQALVEHKESFDASIKVLSIAGVILDSKHGDGVVSQPSALGIQDIVRSNQLKTKIVNDINATHSGLHEHQTVDRYIGEFLWDIKD